MDQKGLKNLIRQLVAEIGQEITLTTSSIKLSTGAKGDTTWEVKVYNPDPMIAANQANYLNAQLRAEHRKEPFKAPASIPYPGSSIPSQGNRTSPINQHDMKFGDTAAADGADDAPDPDF